MAERLMVLGGGRHQVGLIRRAQDLGIEVVVVDYYPDAPGRVYASHSVIGDATDTGFCQSVAADYGIDGVITIGTDIAVRTMAHVAEHLSLPCYIGAEASVVATDKVAMTRSFRLVGVLRPRSTEISGNNVAAARALTMPVVVKPADAQGQRATVVVAEPTALGQAIAEACEESRTSRAIVEEFVAGPEVTASVWVEDGEVRLLAVTDRVTYNPPPALGIAFQHISPSLHAQGRLEDIRQIVHRVAKAYGVLSGPLYVQLIVGADDIYVVEAGARVGGGHESSLIPVVAGVDVIDRLIDLALGGRCDPVAYDAASDPQEPHGLVNFLLAHPGTIESTGTFPEPGTPGLIEGDYYVGPGYRQGVIVNSLGRIGYFIARGGSRAELLERARSIYDSLEVRDVAGAQLLFWPDPSLVLS